MNFPSGSNFLRLRDRIEYAEILLCITAARHGPLPAAVVCREIVIIQLLHEMAFTPAPVDTEILGEKTRDHHAQAIVHVSGLVELQYGGIHQRIG